MNIGVDGTIALVIGAGSGIGAATARALADAGAAVTLGDLGENRIARLAGEISAAGGTAHCTRLDLADAASVEADVGSCVRMTGVLRLLVNNRWGALAQPGSSRRWHSTCCSTGRVSSPASTISSTGDRPLASNDGLLRALPRSDRQHFSISTATT